MKIYWNTAVLIHLHIVSGYFRMTMTELSSLAYKPKIFTLLPFTGSLPTSLMCFHPLLLFFMLIRACICNCYLIYR